MAAIIKWTYEAQETFEQNINYLEKHWGENEIRNFVKQVEQIILKIEKSPEMYSPSAKSQYVRKVTVNKYIVLYYKYYPGKNEIILLTFWHNKQDPGKLKY